MFYQLISSFDPSLDSDRHQGEWRSASKISGVVSMKGDRRKIYSVVNFDCNEDLVIISINAT